MIQLLIFYAFSGLLILSALTVIFTRNPVRASLFLVLSFALTAPLWIMANAEFLGLVLVFVYVGAVMTLFLFVVMMLNISEVPKQRSLVAYYPLVLFLIAAMVAMILYALKPALPHLAQHALQPHPANYSNVKALGSELYTRYVLPFELAAALLLVAIVSAISLAFRGARNRKSQDISKQIAVKAQDRIRMVK